jgi:cell division protein FtsB
MRAFNYLIALWVAFAVYGVSSALYGAIGLSAYRQLEADRDQQWANMKNLQRINEDLENAKNSLLYDQDTIAVYARELGYGKKDERFIRIVGLRGTKNSYDTTGQIFRAGKPDFISDRTLKIAALCTGIMGFAFLLILDIIRGRQGRL